MGKPKPEKSAPAPASSPAAAIRDRVKEFRRVPAAQVVENPNNWRLHPDEQRSAMRAVLREIGFAGAALVRELPDGRLELIDGHMRRDEFAKSDAEIPVLVTDLTEEEAATLLAVHDPIAAMAKADREALRGLLDGVEPGGLDDVVGDIERQFRLDVDPAMASIGDDFESVEVEAPAMAWVLVGIPTARYGELSQHVDALAAVEGVICETTVASAETGRKTA